MHGTQQMARFGEGGYPTLSLLLEQVVRQRDLSWAKLRWPCGHSSSPTQCSPAWMPMLQGKGAAQKGERPAPAQPCGVSPTWLQSPNGSMSSALKLCSKSPALCGCHPSKRDSQEAIAVPLSGPQSAFYSES